MLILEDFEGYNLAIDKYDLDRYRVIRGAYLKAMLRLIDPDKAFNLDAERHAKAELKKVIGDK